MLIEDPAIDLYYDYHEELRKLRKSVVQTCKQEFAKENFEKGEKIGEANKEKEMVINMYKDNALIEKICKYANLPIKKVNKIIEDYKKNLK